MNHYLINIIDAKHTEKYTKQIDITCSFEDAKNLVDTILNVFPPGTYAFIHNFDDYVDGYEEHIAHKTQKNDWVIW